MLNINSIDCLLNYNNNVSITDIRKCKTCNEIPLDREFTFEEKKTQCIEDCEFMKCGYKCNTNSSEVYYDQKTGLYERLKS